LGILALTLGGFSSSLLAGNVTECDFLKDKDSESYNPGLYGLCVAWHNADANAKDALADKFLAKAGFPVPGSEDPEPEPDFYCPCWSEMALEDVCALGSPLVADVSPGSSGIVTFVEGITFEGFLNDTGVTSCRHTIMVGGTTFLDTLETSLSSEEAADCQAEIETIATLYMDPLCTGG
jgi:hypothetical protein